MSPQVWFNERMTVNKEELVRLLAQHMSNRQKLQEQAALFGAGETPLSLLNQIEAEQEAITELEVRLAEKVEEPLAVEQYFSRGTRAMIMDDLWEAKRYFELTLDEDPFYPRVAELLAGINAGLMPYVAADAGRREQWSARLGRIPLWVSRLVLWLVVTLVGGGVGAIIGVVFGHWLTGAAYGAGIAAGLMFILLVLEAIGRR